MRLAPIEKPRALILKIAYFFSKKEFGKVLSALNVIYARSIPIMKVSLKIIGAEKKISLPKEEVLFIRYYTSHFNNCPFCSNAIAFMTKKQNIDFQEWQEFVNFRTSNKFSAKKKCLLAYLEEINTTKEATDRTFAELKTFYSEKEIVEITWVNATENFFNLMAKPLGLKSDDLKFESRK